MNLVSFPKALKILIFSSIVKATVSLGYRRADNGLATLNTDNAFIVAASYQIVQNVQIQINESISSGDETSSSTGNGNQATTIMMFAAF